MRIVILIALLMGNSAVNAGVTLFELVVGKSTLAEVQSLYTIVKVGVNSTDRVSIYELDEKQIDPKYTFDTQCNFVSLHFNEDGVLMVLDTSFEGSIYHRMQDEFDKRFHREKITDREALFYGQSAAKYVHDGIEIVFFDVEDENKSRLLLRNIRD